jgi:hypothetical protein
VVLAHNKKYMKQTVEEAAHSFAESRSSGSAFPAYYVGFIAGSEWQKDISSAKWQSKQSPWISVKERLPEDTNEKLVALVDGTIRIAHYDEDYNEDMEYHFWYDCAASESYHRDDVIYWMPIPSFDGTLKQTKMYYNE